MRSVNAIINFLGNKYKTKIAAAAELSALAFCVLIYLYFNPTHHLRN
jgi:energy-converting hydrogenase Eha subunit B